MLRKLDKVEVALGLAIVTTIALLVVVGSMLASTPDADAGAYQDNGRYHLGNTVNTQITTIKVRDAKCLNGEDTASTLKMVQKDKGYSPESNSATYRCVSR